MKSKSCERTLKHTNNTNKFKADIGKDRNKKKLKAKNKTT